MGISSSCSFASLKSNKLLLRLAGTDSIPLYDPFWKNLLEFSLIAPDNSSDARLLEESVDVICSYFVKNNLQTGNFSTLLSILISLIKHVNGSSTTIDEDTLDTLYNSLLIVRILSKYIVQNVPLSSSHTYFETPDNIVSSPLPVDTDIIVEESAPTLSLKHVTKYETSIDELTHYLYKILIELPFSTMSLHVHLESVRVLTTLLSAQLYHALSHTDSFYFHHIMTGRCSENAAPFISTLLSNVVREPEAEPTGLWNYVWSYIPYTGGEVSKASLSDLTNESLLLILLLTNHNTCSDVPNPYRTALFNFGHKDPGSTMGPTSFTFDLDKLYSLFCREHQSDQTTLLLYSLLQGNINVKTFILSRTDIEQLLLPLLSLVYSAEQCSTHHGYMLLIILLILTHDDAFNRYIHDLIIPVVPWYKERVLTNISIGGVLILVILKTIQSNIAKMRDKYLHTNCLATLANMSARFHSFHPYVAEKVLNLFSIIVKKYTRLRTNLLSLHEMPEGQQNITFDQSPAYMESEANTLEDVIRMMLEIFNSCLCNSGKSNPVFIYELLHKRELFVQFQTHPVFGELILNIEAILGFFTARLEERTEGSSVSVSGVMEVIEEGIRQWPSDRLKKCPILKFEYVEESQPEEFFLPYIWTLHFTSSSLYWDTSRISLNTLHTEPS